MRAHQIMTRRVITVKPETTVLEAANLMLKHPISGLRVVDAAGRPAVVATENVEGVKKGHDHLCCVDTMSGMYLESPEDEGLAKAS